MFCSRAETSSLILPLPDISASKAFLWLNLALLLCLCPRQDPVTAKLPQCEKRSDAVSYFRISRKVLTKKFSWKKMPQKKTEKVFSFSKYQRKNNTTHSKKTKPNQPEKKNPSNLSTTNQSSGFVAKFSKPLLKLKRVIFRFSHFSCT